MVTSISYRHSRSFLCQVLFHLSFQSALAVTTRLSNLIVGEYWKWGLFLQLMQYLLQSCIRAHIYTYWEDDIFRYFISNTRYYLTTVVLAAYWWKSKNQLGTERFKKPRATELRHCGHIFNFLLIMANSYFWKLVSNRFYRNFRYITSQ